mgnify:CR=1 FL=1
MNRSPLPSADVHLDAALTRAARASVLLVACDFDGVLAPIAPRPHLATPDTTARAVLVELASLPHTGGAVISGRGLIDLRARLGEAPGVTAVGSHGLESDTSLADGLPASQRELLRELRAAMEQVARDLPGVEIEMKTVSLTVHFRNATPADAERAAFAAATMAEGLEGVYLLSALAAVELLVCPPNKGRAVETLRRHLGATAVVYIGDDTTDEHAFETLTPADVGIRVGEGPTAARWRLEHQSGVAGSLRTLFETRRQWLLERRLIPIERHALLSDQRCVAIIDPRGGVAWMGAPRIDSPALFAGLVGGPGVFTVTPADADGEPVQTYEPDSLVLRTGWPGLRITDYLDASQGRPYQRAGRCELVRVVSCEVPTQAVFAPRLDYGRVPTRLVRTPGGLLVEGWHEPIALVSPGVAWTIAFDGEHHTAKAQLAPGQEPLVLELRYGTANLTPSVLSEASRRTQTYRFWSAWAGSLALPSLHRDLVRRSALTLKALCHGPSGAIAAAATTSLPEHLGGVRNWDYRFCWPRDAALAAASLIRLGNTGVAMRLLDWLAGVVQRCDSPESLRPLYAVDGADVPTEAELSDLAGYGDSRPVRIGNLAAHQVQLDVFGPIVNLVAMLAERGAPVTPEHWRLVEAMVRAVEARWREPDHGIWEIRGPKRHHVHSKTMCWHAVDRALTVASLGMGASRPGWERLRDEIRADVLTHGWSERAGAFTGSYGEHWIDAASLAVGLSGLIAADDPRWRSTVEATERELCDGGFVRRYREADGLPGQEGAWFICTAWLIEALATLGRTNQAREMLDRVAEKAGPLGMFTEEIDPSLGICLGNFPQAYSHLGFIDAAVRLSTD